MPSYALNEPSERPSPASITCTHRFASPHASLPDRAGETMSPFEVAKQTSRANSTHAGPHVVPKSLSRTVASVIVTPLGARSTRFAYAASGSNDGRKSPTGSSTKLRVPGIGWVVFCRSGPYASGSRAHAAPAMSVASQIAIIAPERRGFTTSDHRRTSELCQVGDAAAGLAAREPSV